ncbi:ESX-5 secretion system EccE5 domain protein [Mycobacterium xenopi 3993]|nr:ESX-5 secretion system EccE5 domain protein [Mycobacterium xenopi 3993]
MGGCRWVGRRLAGGWRGGRWRGVDAATREAAMRAQRRFGLDLSWPRLTGVFLIDVAVLALVSHLPDAWQANHIAWWTGVGWQCW